ncbi:MAG TPA: hypothetical protein VFF52_27080 [Isosphaeraceae bacterium]|nr:hypothetical protein [Isosphaeraceae bacterium]
MFKLPVRTWLLHAAAVFSGRHGAVTRQAQPAGCSRPTVYQHARTLEERLADEPAAGPPTEERSGAAAVAAPRPSAGHHLLLDKDKVKELATVAFARGLSLRPIEDLLGRLLPADQVPDHSTLGRLVQAEATRAGEVLAALDPACADRGDTLALDEIFLGGDRPGSGSRRPAGRPSSVAPPPTARPRPGWSNSGRSPTWSSPSRMPPRGSPRRWRSGPRGGATTPRPRRWSTAGMSSTPPWKPSGC